MCRLLRDYFPWMSDIFAHLESEAVLPIVFDYVFKDVYLVKVIIVI